jgi:hypothetical protein
MGEWNARPKCTVEREWLRKALNKLKERLSELPDETNVAFSFDGSVFSTRCDGELIAIAGQGAPWTVTFNAGASALRHVPKRLMNDSIEVSIWESNIRIGNCVFPGTLEVSGPARPPTIQ